MAVRFTPAEEIPRNPMPPFGASSGVGLGFKRIFRIRPVCRVSVPGETGPPRRGWARARGPDRVPRRSSWHHLRRSRWHSRAAPSASPPGQPEGAAAGRCPAQSDFAAGPLPTPSLHPSPALSEQLPALRQPEYECVVRVTPPRAVARPRTAPPRPGLPGASAGGTGGCASPPRRPMLCHRPGASLWLPPCVPLPPCQPRPRQGQPRDRPC